MNFFKRLFRLWLYAAILLAVLNITGLKIADLNKIPYSNAAFDVNLTRNSLVATQPVTTTDIESAVERVTPAVVSLFGYKTVSTETANNINLPFFGISVPVPTKTQMQVDAGTGFFVDSRGYILTSKHVVSDTDAYYIAELSDGTQKAAQVIFRDPYYDIAVLKVTGNDFPTLQLGDSSRLRRGQTVIGIGNAFGQFKNLTAMGKIDALHQNIISSDEEGNEHQLYDLFQSSMQLYPGHSGGPTFDINGNVVGINDAIAIDENNISFSIPINYAKDTLTKALAEQ